MEKQDRSLLFLQLPKEVLSQLESVSVQAECFLLKKIKNDKKIPKNAKSSHRRVNIQLRANFVVQYDDQKKAIISGFQVDISVTFKILRAPSMSDEQAGAILGIQFRSQIFENFSIFLYLLEKNQKNQKKEFQKLQEFGSKLGKKYILRDGFHDIYRAVKKIGKGVTASVYKALRLTDRKQFAVKSFKKQQYYKADNGRGKMAFEKQFRTLTTLNSDYLCELVSVYESDNSIYIVMQLLTRSLYYHLKFKGFPSVQNVKEIMAKLLIGLGQMHKKNIMHRDLKLENIMVVDEQGSRIKPIIIDFGLAQIATNLKFLYVKCGTPGYVAPEILNTKVNQIQSPPYNTKCDIFSLGVIFFILMVGRTLFEGEEEKDVVRKNKQCQIDYNFTQFTRLTEEAKVLLRKMLQKDPNQRAPVHELLHFQFFKQTLVLKDFHVQDTAVSQRFIEQK